MVWKRGRSPYFNSALKELSYTNGSEDYIQITDIDGVEIQLI